eukprot:15431367-Alexandrium_andersonii.AAC.1
MLGRAFHTSTCSFDTAGMARFGAVLASPCAVRGCACRTPVPRNPRRWLSWGCMHGCMTAWSLELEVHALSTDGPACLDTTP